MSEGQRKKAIPIPVKRECASSVTFPALKKSQNQTNPATILFCTFFLKIKELTF